MLRDEHNSLNDADQQVHESIFSEVSEGVSVVNVSGRELTNEDSQSLQFNDSACVHDHAQQRTPTDIGWRIHSVSRHERDI